MIMSKNQYWVEKVYIWLCKKINIEWRGFIYDCVKKLIFDGKGLYMIVLKI